MACITGNLALMCHRGYSKSLPTPSVLVNLSAFLLRMKNGTKPRWIHPAHMRAFLLKIAASLSSFFFFFFSFFPVGVSPLLPLGPALWCSAHCWLGVLWEGAAWPWGGITTTGACLHGAQHTRDAGSGQSSSLPSPRWSLLQHPHLLLLSLTP